MAISADVVRKLRERTGQGMMDCKRALEESGGDAEKAVEILRKKGLATAEKRAGRSAAQGRIHSYIHHNGKVGVIVEVNCETDFVAKNEQFQAFLNDLCLHICAAAPLAVRREEIPANLVETERRIAREQVQGKKPDNIIAKIVEGKLTKWYADHVLLEQPFVKDQERSVQDILTEMIAKTGEKIVIQRFARFEVGETASEE
jgi:elongation factor Ts